MLFFLLNIAKSRSSSPLQVTIIFTAIAEVAIITFTVIAEVTFTVHCLTVHLV